MLVMRIRDSAFTTINHSVFKEECLRYFSIFTLTNLSTRRVHLFSSQLPPPSVLHLRVLCERINSDYPVDLQQTFQHFLLFSYLQHVPGSLFYARVADDNVCMVLEGG